MSKSKILNRQELNFLLDNAQFLKVQYNTKNAFYEQFVRDTIQKIEEVDSDYYLSIFNKHPSDSHRHTSEFCADFLEHFQDKIAIPHTYTLLHFFNQNYSNIHTSYLDLWHTFIENEIGEDGALMMFENYLSDFECYEPRLAKYWLKLSIKNKKIINTDKCIKIVGKLLRHQVNTTSERNFILNCLTFANNYKDMKDHLIKFIESNQDDSVFMQHVEKLKTKIKDLNWSEKKIPDINGKQIVGSIELNPEYFIKEYKLTRGESEKFIKVFLQYFSTEFKSTHSNCSIIISSESVEGYSKKEKKFLDIFDKVKLLPPYWRKNNTVEENNYFFQNHIEKISLHNHLTETILTSKENDSNKNEKRKRKI